MQGIPIMLFLGESELGLVRAAVEHIEYRNIDMIKKARSTERKRGNPTRDQPLLFLRWESPKRAFGMAERRHNAEATTRSRRRRMCSAASNGLSIWIILQTISTIDYAALNGLTMYNFPPMPPKWDRTGIFYATFCAIWAAVVFAETAFLWANRRNTIWRLRGMALITYPIGGTMPVVISYDVQDFLTGIWFPLGIACFHAGSWPPAISDAESRESLAHEERVDAYNRALQIYADSSL
ncbi:integral membrane protein [Colletotrichum orchidophilum]|uniref:Integral membrane protein n=1 Tax=Colletotrichum orchidophilum TaxID=1209926 RepID=A0A1G4AN64_9PEZI|nr:uncharacterized protein CORC01_14084 [Colletotrichum orchidophilum]OHE90619.1 integral membrane protein [Colletotrichum orchidophilum]